jgi:plastocyanin
MPVARLLMVSAVAVMVAAACSSSTSPSGGGGAGGHSTTITVGNNLFSPTPDTVPPGQVTFTWSTPSNGHNVMWDSGPGTLPAPSSTLTSGTYVVTLQATGATPYLYHCSLHNGMTGRIVVQ